MRWTMSLFATLLRFATGPWFLSFLPMAAVPHGRGGRQNCGEDVRGADAREGKDVNSRQQGCIRGRYVSTPLSQRPPRTPAVPSSSLPAYKTSLFSFCSTTYHPPTSTTTTQS